MTESTEREPLLTGPSRDNPSVAEGGPQVSIEESPFPEEEKEERERGTMWQEFLHDINPIDVEGWGEMKIYSKVYECFKVS